MTTINNDKVDNTITKEEHIHDDKCGHVVEEHIHDDKCGHAVDNKEKKVNEKENKAIVAEYMTQLKEFEEKNSQLWELREQIVKIDYLIEMSDGRMGEKGTSVEKDLALLYGKAIPFDTQRWFEEGMKKGELEEQRKELVTKETPLSEEVAQKAKFFKGIDAQVGTEVSGVDTVSKAESKKNAEIVDAAKDAEKAFGEVRDELIAQLNKYNAAYKFNCVGWGGVINPLIAKLGVKLEGLEVSDWKVALPASLQEAQNAVEEVKEVKAVEAKEGVEPVEGVKGVKGKDAVPEGRLYGLLKEKIATTKADEARLHELNAMLEKKLHESYPPTDGQTYLSRKDNLKIDEVKAILNDYTEGNIITDDVKINKPSDVKVNNQPSVKITNQGSKTDIKIVEDNKTDVEESSGNGGTIAAVILIPAFVIAVGFFVVKRRSAKKAEEEDNSV